MGQPDRETKREAPGLVAHRVCDVFELMVNNQPEGFFMHDVAELPTFTKTVAYRYLATLHKRRYLTRHPITHEYKMGPAFMTTPSKRKAHMADKIRIYLTELWEQTGETVSLAVQRAYLVSFLEVAESPRQVRMRNRQGSLDEMHSTALGKAMASTMTNEEVQAYLEAGGMRQRTARTITELDAFLEDMEAIRERGYAIDDREQNEIGRAVAVPVQNPDDRTAIGIAAPLTRLPMEKVHEYGQMLMDTARVVNDELAK